MMNQLKRNISLLLCFLLAFTTIFVTAPEETQAATTYYFSGLGSYWADDTSKINATVTISKGESNFYAGDLITVFTGEYPNRKEIGYLSNLKGVTYKSSNTSVAAIDKSTGKVTIKKTGTAKITMTYKKKSINFDLKVVSSASKLYKEIANSYDSSYYNYGKTSYWKSLAAASNKEAKAFLKKTGTNVTTINKSNRYKLLNAYKSVDNYNYTSGHYYLSAQQSKYNYNEPYQVWIYSANALRASVIYEKIYTYITKFVTFSSNYGSVADNVFEIKSISGKAKSDTIKVTLTEKVTADKIFALNYIYSWDQEVKESSIYTFPVQIQRTSTGHKYYAIATIKKGSNQMTIQLKNTKLVKNADYKVLFEIASTYVSWNAGSSVMSNNTSIGVDTFKAK